MIRYQETEYGFIFGSANVTRVCSDDTKGWAVIGIKTPKEDLQIYVTKTGKVRVFKNHKEIKITNDNI